MLTFVMHTSTYMHANFCSNCYFGLTASSHTLEHVCTFVCVPMCVSVWVCVTACIKWNQDHYLLWKFSMHLHIKNSCEIVYFINKKKKTFNGNKKETIQFFILYDDVSDFLSFCSFWIMDSHKIIQAFTIKSRKKQGILHQNRTFLQPIFFVCCFVFSFFLLFALYLFEIMRNDTAHIKSTEIIS